MSRYTKFDLSEYLVFLSIGFLVSYFIGWLFSIKDIYAFPLGYSLMYYLLMGHKSNIFSFLFSELDKKDNQTDKAFERWEDVYKDVMKLYDHTLNMQLYESMTKEEAIKNLKKVTKGIQDIYEKEEKRKTEIVKNL
jgi:hypothetical protein